MSKRRNIKYITQYNYLIDKVKTGVMVIFKEDGQLKEVNIKNFKEIIENNNKQLEEKNENTNR
tara:strand:+ start:403 stop:591 length:189 start_codon:yes stop_codon:yes gene_type:complete